PFIPGPGMHPLQQRHPAHNLVALSTLIFFILPFPCHAQATDKYLRDLLNEYYTGRVIRLKVPIPANGKGLVIEDGAISNVVSGETGAKVAAQAGDPLLISHLRFERRKIEIELSDGDEDSPARRGRRFLFWRIGKQAPPRLSLRFSHAVTIGDLNIQTINQLLSPALDVSGLAPVETVMPAPAAPAAPRRNRAEMVLLLAERRARAEGVPTAQVREDRVFPDAMTGEVTIECAGCLAARLYVDGAFSGPAPRTIRVLAGIHTFQLEMETGPAWRQRYFVPAGKTSLIRYEAPASRNSQ
ncbi:MAG: hypothetical protein ACKV2V_21690, partial [Blastocatellia bacterium]